MQLHRERELRSGPKALQHAWEVAASVADPELPFLNLEELGILRSVDYQEGNIVVKLTPTYSGCPAMHVIENDVQQALSQAGIDATVERLMTPAWSSDWISEQGRNKLAQHGIAAPLKPCASQNELIPLLFMPQSVSCPFCNSEQTERVSEFGSTACKAQYKCLQCAEPFDYFKFI